MKAEYQETFINGETLIKGEHKQVELPFGRVSARALVIHRSDGSILGTLHREGGSYALPGGAVENGESTLQAAQRELQEENFTLFNPEWQENIAVDFFNGYRELSVWHVVLVDGVQIGMSEENIASQWFPQDQDPWYPSLHEHILLAIARCCPEYSKARLIVS